MKKYKKRVDKRRSLGDREGWGLADNVIGEIHGRSMSGHFENIRGQMKESISRAKGKDYEEK